VAFTRLPHDSAASQAAVIVASSQSITSCVAEVAVAPLIGPFDHLSRDPLHDAAMSATPGGGTF
jgi:hypothetical protein